MSSTLKAWKDTVKASKKAKKEDYEVSQLFAPQSDRRKSFVDSFKDVSMLTLAVFKVFKIVQSESKLQSCRIYFRIDCWRICYSK